MKSQPQLRNDKHIRAVGGFLCVGRGGGGVPDPKNFFEPQSGEENCFGLLGGSEGMLAGKCLK